MSAGEAAQALRSGDVDAVLGGGELRGKEELDTELVGVLQASAQLREAGASGGPPLRVTTIEPVDDREDALGGLAFFTILILYGQLLTYGFWVASGVVEEKASRVVEILLSTIRPRELLAGKVIGLGLLGLGQLLLVAAVGVFVATATGVVDVDADLLIAVGLSLLWFVLGYAFFACAFACAGALVPRLEELQASTMPLTLTIMVSLFVAFAVNSDPDGTLAHVTAFIPFTAPMTLPPRILVGAAPWYEVVGGALVTIARGGGADPARRAHLLRRRAAHRLGDQAARRLARRPRLADRQRPLAADALGVVRVRRDHGAVGAAAADPDPLGVGRVAAAGVAQQRRADRHPGAVGALALDRDAGAVVLAGARCRGSARAGPCAAWSRRPSGRRAARPPRRPPGSSRCRR